MSKPLLVLIWRLILPLSIISFAVFTKWWYVLPVDAPDTLMIGFPFAFASDGWATSMSLQIFIVELSVDFIIYFLFWALLIFIVDRYWKKIRIPKILTGILWTFSTIIVVISVWVASLPEQDIQVRRNWDSQAVLVTGYKFMCYFPERPDFAKYDPSKKR